MRGPDAVAAARPVETPARPARVWAAAGDGSRARVVQSWRRVGVGVTIAVVVVVVLLLGCS